MKRILMACALALVACTKPAAPVVPPAVPAVVVAPAPVAAPPAVALHAVVVAPAVAAKASAKAAKASATAAPHAAKPPTKAKTVSAGRTSPKHPATGEAAAYAKAYANAARANALLGRAQYLTGPTGADRVSLIEAHREVGGFYRMSYGPALSLSVLETYVLVLTEVATGESAFVGAAGSSIPYAFRGLPECRDKLAEIMSRVDHGLEGFKLGCIAIGDAPVLQKAPKT